MTNALQQIKTTDTLSYSYSQHPSTPPQHGHGSQNSQHLQNLKP